MTFNFIEIWLVSLILLTGVVILI
ncbi:MAG: hypothetical protein RL127_1184, partial [Bacteroidota bacterium]